MLNNDPFFGLCELHSIGRTITWRGDSGEGALGDVIELCNVSLAQSCVLLDSLKSKL